MSVTRWRRISDKGIDGVEVDVRAALHPCLASASLGEDGTRASPTARPAAVSPSPEAAAPRTRSRQHPRGRAHTRLAPPLGLLVGLWPCVASGGPGPAGAGGGRPARVRPGGHRRVLMVGRAAG